MKKPTFIDLFAGCGGLSLGLMNAGWTGLFAIEREENAFESLRHNLVDGTCAVSPTRFEWPDWLPVCPHEIDSFTKRYFTELRKLKGEVDLVCGGPPCQGFSFAGRRSSRDRRNSLFNRYLTIVEIIRPRFLLLENVKGIAVEFNKYLNGRAVTKRRPSAAARIRRRLEEDLGYTVYAGVLKALDLGVPQVRPRYIIVGVRNELVPSDNFDPLHALRGMREAFLTSKGLDLRAPISASDALSDLETIEGLHKRCDESASFYMGSYSRPRTAYQALMHGKMNGATPNSHRLVNHKPETIERFRTALRQSRRGVALTLPEKKSLGIKHKHHFVIMERTRPSHTLTTLPDDILHYSEPRILTVREYARIQSFPDWFEFQGKYTTGGLLRKKEVPRYSQVANAVPPLMAEFLGAVIKTLSDALTPRRNQRRAASKAPEPKLLREGDQYGVELLSDFPVIPSVRRKRVAVVRKTR